MRLIFLAILFLSSANLSWAQGLSDLSPKSGCPVYPKNGQCPAQYIAQKLESFEGHYYVGRPNVWMGAPDFFYRNDYRYDGAKGPLDSDGTPKFYTRSLYLADIGDAPDLGLRRAGPDNATPYSKPAPLGPDVNIGTIYWQAWGERCEPEQEGWYSGCGNMGRNAQIYVRTRGKQTKSSKAGSLIFAVTPYNNPGNPVDRVEINEMGQVVLQQNGSAKQPSISTSEKNTGIYFSPKGLGFSRNGTSLLEVTTDKPANSQTGIVLLVNKSGKIQSSAVEIADPDSCGKGYRCLRLKN